MRIVPIGLALMCLAGCGKPAEPTNQTAQPNESVVEAAFENDQDALASGIENEAADDDANAAAADADRYKCEDGTVVLALYDDDGGVQITVGGKTVTLPGVTAASGSKYRSEGGLAPDKSLTWWTKGDGALLIQAPRGTAEGSPKESVVNCTQQD
ncbi:MliC family protein [Sphingomonas sp. AOB5]|uniref:MliC family protein n=1 Tax=Sphingomonas sp. AOB5 TaxID=3034017 RepID=UPI0023F8A356|nr:MliC family protein [Sphingomonas sp. AOB5]MDF7775195.1 MliC family protein [Sphingomonas sp. AOB5]